MSMPNVRAMHLPRTATGDWGPPSSLLLNCRPAAAPDDAEEDGHVRGRFGRAADRPRS